MKGFTLIEAVLVLAIIGVLAASVLVPPYRCKVTSEAMNKPHRFGYIEGCLIQHKGEWIPITQFRVID